MKNRKFIETEDEIIIEGKDGEEIYLTGKFTDGKAELTDEEGESVTMTYPKASELSEDMIDEIESYTYRKCCEYHQIALLYGEIKNYGMEARVQ